MTLVRTHASLYKDCGTITHPEGTCYLQVVGLHHTPVKLESPNSCPPFLPPGADEGAEAAAEDDKEPGVGLPVEEEEEGVPAEPGGPAQGGPAGERASQEGEPGTEGETGWERGEGLEREYDSSSTFVFIDRI